jgi:hypothetical protein
MVQNQSGQTVLKTISKKPITKKGLVGQGGEMTQALYTHMNNKK